jgi:tRNA modification GTPase
MSGSSSDARLLLVGAEDTIAAVATPRGRSAIALLRVSGWRALEIVSRLAPDWRPEDRHPSLTALLDPDRGTVIDRGVVTLFRAPRSYTGEDLVELGVHGGFLVPELVLNALLAAGARQALPGEYTRRAVMAGKLDLLQAEGIADLVDAESGAMHQIALAHADGVLSRHVGELREAVLRLEALLAYDIDFPDEDEGPIGRERITTAADELLEMLDLLLRTSTTGELVRRGAVVVIAGAPNTGKSSLFNALVGSARAIVTDIPGTTRDAIEAVVDLGQWPVRLVDTAGLRETSNVVERLGIEVSERYLAGADLVLVVGDSGSSLSLAIDRVSHVSSVPIVAVRAKADLVALGDQSGRELVATGYQQPMWVSARTGTGLTHLVDVISQQLAMMHGPRAADTPLLTRERHREAIARARAEVAGFKAVWDSGALPATVAAVHLRAAEGALDGLVGTVDVEDVLDRVFRSFCVGK